MKRLGWWLSGAALALALLLAGSGKPGTRVDRSNRDQILLYGNKAEPQDLDPHTVQGVGEHAILSSLLEGLVAEDPKTLLPVKAAIWAIFLVGACCLNSKRQRLPWRRVPSVSPCARHWAGT